MVFIYCSPARIFLIKDRVNIFSLQQPDISRSGDPCITLALPITLIQSSLSQYRNGVHQKHGDKPLKNDLSPYNFSMRLYVPVFGQKGPEFD